MSEPNKAEGAKTPRKLGARLRELRQARHLSVRTLAARTGFSPSFISNIELDTVSPSIASLEKITYEPGVSLGEFFRSLETPPRMVIRAHERPFYESTWSQSMIQMLTDSNPQRKLSAIMIIIQPQGTSSNRPTTIPHDAIAFITTGELTMTVDGESVDLHTGDTIYLRHHAAIAWQNAHDQPTSMLMVSIAEYTEILADTFQE